MSDKKILLLAIVLVILSLQLKAQTDRSSNPPDTSEYPYYIRMMEDPNVNFFDVQRAFNLYWNGREVTKSSGYKPFKRWEYMMQLYRINPDGSRKPADQAYREYYNYLASHPSGRSA